MGIEVNNPGLIQVEKEQLDQLIAVNKKLAQDNAGYKEDLAKVISGFGQVAQMFGGSGLSLTTMTAILKNKDKLAKTMAPAFEVIQKYTTQNDNPQLDQA